MVKLASTKRKRTAQHGGTAGQMVTASHGHLNICTHTIDKEENVFYELVLEEKLPLEIRVSVCVLKAAKSSQQ